MYKIAFISMHTSPLDKLGIKDGGGLNVYITHLALALQKLGLKVHIFAGRREKYPDRVDINGVQIFHIDIHSKKEDLIYDLDLFLNRMLKIVPQFNYDLIHTHYWLSGAVGVKVKERFNIPLFHTFHTLGVSAKNTSMRLSIETEIVRKVDGIIATTNKEKLLLTQHYNAFANKIKVIPCGVDLTLFHSFSKSLAKNYLNLCPCLSYVLFVGRCVPEKKVDILLKAMSLLNKEVHLIVIGGDCNDYFYKKLLSLTKELHLTNKVSFLGPQPQCVLPYYYNAADVYVLPSSYETFGLTVLEAMACKVPVIVSNVSGVVEFIPCEENVVVIPPGNEIKLKEAIKMLIEDKELNEKMSSSNYHWVKQFDWSLIAKKVVKSYETSLK
jgi:D-inositol-3-phosphate glycosyltransferase